MKSWLALAWKAVDAAPAEEGGTGCADFRAFQAGDVENALKAWDRLPESARNEVFWGQHIIHLSAFGRWNEAAEVILKQIKLTTEAGQEPGADLHAYAAAALRRAGRLGRGSRP